MAADKKTRAWTFLLYPESAPANWVQLLRETHLGAIVSPLHDKDVWQDTTDEHIEGELKKPHYHCMILFDGPARATQALQVLEPLGIKYVQPVASVRTLTRYFAHLDDADKAQYDVADIQSFNGAAVDTSRELSPEEKRAIRNNVLSWIRENSITEYKDVIYYALDTEPDWLDFVTSHTIMLTGLLRSIRYSGLYPHGKDGDN